MGAFAHAFCCLDLRNHYAKIYSLGVSSIKWIGTPTGGGFSALSITCILARLHTIHTAARRHYNLVSAVGIAGSVGIVETLHTLFVWPGTDLPFVRAGTTRGNHWRVQITPPGRSFKGCGNHVRDTVNRPVCMNGWCGAGAIDHGPQSRVLS